MDLQEVGTKHLDKSTKGYQWTSTSISLPYFNYKLGVRGSARNKSLHFPKLPLQDLYNLPEALLGSQLA